ncbi:hypothetical protein [Paenibacillus sp. J22TS3]|uniref:hypothetical protein n=1 Tax=Paenibacillus sp. J22TS3 TaxID=2807192 RepID=UPI001BD174E6|nr:hypothetical protein [Paenibacillus sp. J22TS3]
MGARRGDAFGALPCHFLLEALSLGDSLGLSAVWARLWRASLPLPAWSALPAGFAWLGCGVGAALARFPATSCLKRSPCGIRLAWVRGEATLSARFPATSCLERSPCGIRLA